MRIVCIDRSIWRGGPHCGCARAGKLSLTCVNRWSRYDDAEQTSVSVLMSASRQFQPLRRRTPGDAAGPATICVVAVGLSLALAGCGEQKLSASELVTASRTISVEPSRALALPPPGSLTVTGVTQRSYDNAVSQTVSLATRGRTPGENAIHVAFFTAADLPDSIGVEGNLLREPSMDDFALAREMDERMPGVAMAPSAVFVQNKYGPFGYATGRGVGGEACLYAWQRMANGDSIFLPRSGVISVRIRVCDPAASEASLLRLAYSYAINASLRRSGWNPVGDAPSPAPELGQAGAPIFPVPQASFPDSLEQRPAVRPRPARPARSERRIQEAPDPIPDKPLEGYPTVPPPPSP